MCLQFSYLVSKVTQLQSEVEWSSWGFGVLGLWKSCPLNPFGNLALTPGLLIQEILQYYTHMDTEARSKPPQCLQSIPVFVTVLDLTPD